jgi:ATP-binding cassette subfamily B protein
MLKLAKYLKTYLWPLFALVILVLIQVYANLKLPDYTAKIVNEGIINGDNSLIVNSGLMMLLISLLGGVCAVGVGYLASRIATGFSMLIRNRVFARVESFSLTEFNKFSTASLITRTTNDVQQIQLVLIMILRLFLMAPITGVWAVYKAYINAPSMTWIMGLAVGILVLVIAFLFAVALPKFQLLQKLVDKLNLVTRENLTGLRVIRAFNNEHLEQDKFQKANKDLTDVNLFVNRLMVILQPIMMLLLNLTAVAIVWVGAHEISANTLQIGDMLAFMQYSMQVIFSFLMFSIIFILIPRASVSAQRVSEVLETEPIIKDPKNPVSSVGGQGRIEFDDVTFCYPSADEPVLDKISFVAEPSQTTAIVGSTGSGKSTLINLIPRFYDANSGEIKIDGMNVKDIKLEDLYAKIGYVPQKAILFSGTVESNIKYGAPKATDTQIEEYASIAQAKEFIKGLEEKYKNPIAQGGTNVSGGQKQRLAIARAIAREPEIFIFDDSFSALDFRTDANLRAALKKKTKNKTVLIVAQRISTIIDADKIIVLEDGKIVAEGKHQDLLKSCQVYREIASSQLTQEELRPKTKIRKAAI